VKTKNKSLYEESGITMKLIQYHLDKQRYVGLVESSSTVHKLNEVETTYDLVQQSLSTGKDIQTLVDEHLNQDKLDYEQLYSEGHLLPPLDHSDPAHCFATGTGLNHLGSAIARDSMHTKDDGNLSDSMKMYRLGVEGGKPRKGEYGAQPEWFYKGDGSCIVPPGSGLELPPYALSGGEEAELVGLYIISNNGEVIRVGYTLGNEFSDHTLEQQNYLYLAHSKLRQCSLGPELYIGELPQKIEGKVRILRNDTEVWSDTMPTGEAHMSHTLENLELHHFKYKMFRRLGDVHCHFFGAATLSSMAGVKLQEGDVMEFAAPFSTQPLRNTFKKSTNTNQPQQIRSLWSRHENQ
jgi:hypothetical protein